ncbi:crystallin J1A [Aplysia californica]|uniref:Crystallin J1A n=1 Tax=Aplysia californica TaxID=6500 RepID=A0ABM0JG05_APLCA|nr:crystallin J1A [Aplysia californica]
MAAVLELPPLQQRKVAAIVGACVADAAAQPLHWIYNEGKMASLIEGKEEIEFRHPSANPFYRIPTGSNSCYGDQAYVMLKSLVESKGLDIDHLTKATYDFFGPNSSYESDETNKYLVGKEDKINIKKSLPIHGPWRHGCIKDFLANMYADKNPTGSETDDQIDCAIRVIPLVAMYAGQPDLLDKAEAALRVLQESDTSIACGLAAVRVLEQYILTGKPEDVLQKVTDTLNDPDRNCPQDLDRAVIGQLRAVVRALGTSHEVAVPKYFQKN